MGAMTDVVLAHQGGWDEILLFAAPVLLAVWAVRRVERRGKATSDDKEPSDQAESELHEAD